jgi:hypothetical protein
MADANGNIDALIYVDDVATEAPGQCRHGFVELNGERADLANPQSVAKF